MLPHYEVGLATDTEPSRAPADHLREVNDDAFPSLANGRDPGIIGIAIDDRPAPADHGFRNN